MDVIAGERERRSLVPLLTNPVSRQAVVLGKWLAVVIFSTAGSLLCLVAFRFIYKPVGNDLSVVLLTGILPLVFLAAALEVGLSAMCSSLKEAQSYLSMLGFVPMTIGMFGVFFRTSAPLALLLPFAGQQAQLQHWLVGQPVALLPSLFLALFTTAMAGAVLRGTATWLERDRAIYGR